MNPKNQISPNLKRALLPSQERKPIEVVISQRCRQLSYRLWEKGLATYPLPLIDAIALRAGNHTIARLSTRADVSYIEKNIDVHIEMDKALCTVGIRQEATAENFDKSQDFHEDMAVFREVYTDPPGAFSGIQSNLSDSSNRLTGEGVTIAILDTGVEPHPDFEGRIVAFADLINERTETYDDNGHGTMCAGCAAGDGSTSRGRYMGAAPRANLVVVKSMDAEGIGSMLSVLQGLQWISDHRKKYDIRVVSLSIGVEPDGARDALSRAAEALWTQGIVVVAAAGNTGPEQGSVNSPGISQSILTVGAVNDRGETFSIPDFSSRGFINGVYKPELLAPGVELITARGREYGVFTGTSAATPVVAGCAALLLERHPDWSPDQVKAELIAAARSITGDRSMEGYGLVQMRGES